MTPREIRQKINSLELTVAAAYFASIRKIIADAAIARLSKVIESGGDAMEALAIVASSFGTLAEQVRSVYISGGTLESEGLRPIPRPSGPVLRVRFDVRNVRAEQYLRQESSRLVTQIVTEQRDAIRAVLDNGAAIGRNPRQTALDIVGRVAENGRRAGGIVGLTEQQAQFVINARNELGDVTQMPKYFDRIRRDRRLDGIVRSAMKAGKPVKAEDIDRIAGRYSDRLLQLRGEIIARTETLRAFNAGRDEVYEQAIEGGLKPEFVTKTWDTAMDGRERDAHRAMDNQRKPFREPYTSPTGARLRYPGDTSLGAGAKDVIQCRCASKIKIDYIGANLG